MQLLGKLGGRSAGLGFVILDGAVDRGQIQRQTTVKAVFHADTEVIATAAELYIRSRGRVLLGQRITCKADQ